MAELDAFLDALIMQACRAPEPSLSMTPDDLVDFIRQAQRRAKPTKPTKPKHWSPWMNWRGCVLVNKCPLPPYVPVRWDDADSEEWTKRADYWNWEERRGRFRYLADNDAGWLKRPPGWISPAELWRDDCLVRIEWKAINPDGDECHGDRQPLLKGSWNSITHIRLVARGRKPEMPSGFRIDIDGNLYAETGLILTKAELERYGPDAIRQAVEAWLETV